MRVESLENLSAAVAAWRKEKRHPREKIPEALLERARGAARAHGVSPVVRTLKVDRRRLLSAAPATRGVRGPGPASPAYSRLELAGPANSGRLFAELELPSGVKLRLYAASEEALGLLSSVVGGGR